jgi:hypothetical protein
MSAKLKASEKEEAKAFLVAVNKQIKKSKKLGLFAKFIIDYESTPLVKDYVKLKMRKSYPKMQKALEKTRSEYRERVIKNTLKEPVSDRSFEELMLEEHILRGLQTSAEEKAEGGILKKLIADRRKEKREKIAKEKEEAKKTDAEKGKERLKRPANNLQEEMNFRRTKIYREEFKRLEELRDKGAFKAFTDIHYKHRNEAREKNLIAERAEKEKLAKAKAEKKKAKAAEKKRKEEAKKAKAASKPKDIGKIAFEKAKPRPKKPDLVAIDKLLENILGKK